jgi:hypothetical protein
MSKSVAFDLARYILAGVFIAAAISKSTMRNPAASVVQLRIPQAWALPVIVAVVLAEIAASVLLALSQTAILGGMFTLALLAIFTLFIAVNFVRGRRPSCPCFGGGTDKPIGVFTLARNVALGCLAVLVVSFGTSSSAASHPVLIGPFAFFATSVSIFALTHRSRFSSWSRRQKKESVSPVRESSSSLGVQIPDIVVDNIHGEHVNLGSTVKPGHPSLIILTHYRCEHCHELLSRVKTWQASCTTLHVVVVMSGASDREAVTVIKHLVGDRILLDLEGKVLSSLGCKATPGAVLVGSDGRIASKLVYGSSDIEALYNYLWRRDMQDQVIQERLNELYREMSAGQGELERVEARREYLRETLLRIGGAIHILEELQPADGQATNGSVNASKEESAGPTNHSKISAMATSA